MLTPEQIDLAIQQHVDPVATYGRLHNFARAIEAEVRKQDDVLILQLVEALEYSSPNTNVAYAWQDERWALKRFEAITAGRARLGEKPS